MDMEMECDVCGQNHITEECPMLGLSTSDFKAQISRARLTVPHYLGVIDYADGEVGIMAMETISNKTQLGPFEAKKTCHCPLDHVFILKILSADGNTICLDTSSENQCNWMALVQVAQTGEEQNCMAYQLGINIYFSTTRDVPSGTPLRVWYASKYAQKLGKPTLPDGKTRTMLGMDISGWQSEDPPSHSQASSSEGLLEAASYLSSILPSASTSQADSLQTIMIKEEIRADSQQIFSCSKCPQVFLSQNDYAIHLRGHLMPTSLMSHSGRTGRRGRPWNRIGVVTPLGKKGPGRPRKNVGSKEPGEVLARSAPSRPYKKRGRPRKTVPAMIADDTTETAPGEQTVSDTKEDEGTQNEGTGEQLTDSSKLTSDSAASIAAADNCEDCNHDKLSASGVNSMEEDKKCADEHHATIGSVHSAGMNNSPKSPTAVEVNDEDGKEPHSADLTSQVTSQQTSSENPQPLVKVAKRRGRPPKNLTKNATAGETSSSPAKASASALTPSLSSSRRVQPRRMLKGKRTSTFRYPGESSSDDEEDDKGKGKNVLKQALKVKEYSDDDEEDDDGDNERGDLEPGEVVRGGVEITVQTQQGVILSKAPVILLDQDTGHTQTVDPSILSLVTTGVDSSGQQVMVLQSTPSTSITPTPTPVTCEPVEEDTTAAPDEDDASSSMTTTPSGSQWQQQGCGSSHTGSQDGLATLVDAALSSQTMQGQDKEEDSMEVQRTGEEEQGAEEYMTSDDPDWKGPTTVNREGSPRKRRPKRRKGDDPNLEMLEESIQVVDGPDGSREFACGVCLKRFQQLKYLKMHLPAHTDKFLCTDCGRRFARHESLQKHVCEDWLVLVEKIKSEEDGSILFRCKECGRSFPQMDHARRHASMHRGTWACAKCQRTFPKRQLLLEHKCGAQVFMDSTADTGGEDCSSKNNAASSGGNNSAGEGDGGEGGGEFPCDICRQTFSSAKYLFRHMAMHTELFKCGACGKCYSRKDSLQRHVLKCCPEMADDYSVFSCDKCKKTFGTRLGLENHVLNCGKFQCCDCRIAFFTEEDLTQHKCEGRIIDDAAGVQFPCKECGKTFASLPYLSRHEASHHAAFECEVCKKVFVRGEELSWHQPVCVGTGQIEQDGVTSCQVCQTQFTDVRLFREHFQVHTHPYRCDKCGKRFIKVGTLHTHKCDNVVSNTATEEEGVWQCDICEKTFKNERYLARHKQLHGVPSFDCEYCGKKFIRKDYLNDHKCVLPDGTPVRVVRKKNRLYIRDDLVCRHCHKTFSSRSNLNKHMRVHGDKEAECHICGKRFHYHSYLKLHIATVHDRQFQYQCSHCGKILFSKTGLIAHIKQFHQDTVKLYPCPKCGKTFRQKGNMRTHLYSHTKERTFKCELCSKAFKYPDQLNRHRLEHTMSEKIKCPYCDKRFVRASELRQHERLFHSGVIYTCHVCHESCAHKHTIMRHYRRKHPEVADIFDKQPDFLDSLQKAVDKVTSLPAQRVPIQLTAPNRSGGEQKPRIIRVLNDGGEEQEYIITTAPHTSTVHDDAGGSTTTMQEAMQVLQDINGAVYETDSSGMITQTVEDDEGSHTVIILQVVNQDDLGTEVQEVSQIEGDHTMVVHNMDTIEVPLEMSSATSDIPTTTEGHVETVSYTADMETSGMESVIISAADVDNAPHGTITLVTSGLTSGIVEGAAAMETGEGVMATTAAMETETVVETMEVPQVVTSMVGGDGSEQIVHYI